MRGVLSKMGLYNLIENIVESIDTIGDLITDGNEFSRSLMSRKRKIRGWRNDCV